MPHTSHPRPHPPTGSKTKAKHGRTLISSPDGWTHVVSSTSSSVFASSNASSRSTSFAKTSYSTLKSTSLSASNSCPPTTTQAEAPPHLTDESALGTHKRYVERLRRSSFWRAVEQQVRTTTKEPGTTTTATDQTASSKQGTQRTPIIRTALLFGLGSPTGLAHGGLVDRRRTAGWQLAWFACVVSLIEEIQGESIGCKLAQEPLYNVHDARLHESLGIRVVESPSGFESLGEEGTLVFAPGAEREVLRRILQLPTTFKAKKDDGWRYTYPAIFVGCELDAERTDEEAKFLRQEGDDPKRKWRKIPTFEEDEAVFWNMWIYYDLRILA